MDYTVAHNHDTYEKVLTETAKQRIRDDHLAGKYQARMDASEPPYMPPSVDPDAYSMVRLSLSPC